MNPAARLLAIHDKLVSYRDNMHMTHAWASVFQLDPSSPHCEDDVTACVVAVRAEIQFARKLLEAQGVSASMTSPAFERLANLAAPSGLNAGWASNIGPLQSPEVRKIFEWAQWALKEEDEAEIPTEEMGELHAEIAALETALQNTEMSDFLRDFVGRQLDTIRSALRLYGIQGARPIRDALQTVAGAYTVERKRVEAEHAAAPEAAKGILSKASGVIDKTAKACDNIEKIGKFGEKAWQLGTTLGPLVLPYLAKLGG